MGQLFPHPTSLVGAEMLGKRKHTPTCSSEELSFLCRKKDRGHRRKISVVDMVLRVFIGFLHLPPAWKVFLWGQKSPPNDLLSVVVAYSFFSSEMSWTEVQKKGRGKGPSGLKQFLAAMQKTHWGKGQGKGKNQGSGQGRCPNPQGNANPPV